MTLDRLLNSIGKRTFIKYYYNFKDKSRDYCICHFDEEFTDKAKSSKTGHAKHIFNNAMEKEALECISSSERVDSFTREQAKKILKMEFGN